jgi:hypothetical protein
MTDPTKISRRVRLLLTGFAAVLAFFASAIMSPPAQAFWIGFGAPCCGWYGAGPYYGYPYPPPYYYAPPAGYYPPPPGAYAPPAAPAPSAYTPGAAPMTYPPASPMAAPAAPSSPAVTYTNKPAFTNAAGETCRQYKTTDTTSSHPIDVYGTACQQSDGQWRVVK